MCSYKFSISYRALDLNLYSFLSFIQHHGNIWEKEVNNKHWYFNFLISILSSLLSVVGSWDEARGRGHLFVMVRNEPSLFSPNVNAEPRHSSLTPCCGENPSRASISVEVRGASTTDTSSYLNDWCPVWTLFQSHLVTTKRYVHFFFITYNTMIYNASSARGKIS